MKVGDTIEILETRDTGSGWWVKGDQYMITRVEGNQFSALKPDGDRNGWNIDQIKYKVVNSQLFPIY